MLEVIAFVIIVAVIILLVRKVYNSKSEDKVDLSGDKYAKDYDKRMDTTGNNMDFFRKDGDNG